jgi:hypothetical protein
LGGPTKRDWKKKEDSIFSKQKINRKKVGPFLLTQVASKLKQNQVGSNVFYYSPFGD